MNRIFLPLLAVAGLSLFLVFGLPGPAGGPASQHGLSKEALAAAGKDDSANEKKAAPAQSGAEAGARDPEKKYPPQDPALGAIEGRVTLEGDPPALKPVEVPANNKDHAACAAHVQDLQLVISGAREVQNAVVSVAGYKPQTKTEPRDITIDNKHCTFLPRIQATTIGSKLKITSSDPFLHNTHGLLAANFNKAIAKGDEVIQKLPKQGAVLIKCDFHTWMQAWIQVFAHDLFDVTDAKGTFKLVNVPPGEHEIEIWHEFLESPKQKVKIEAGKTAKLDFALRARKKS